MKRKILSFIFTLCLILPCAFMLSACDIFKSEKTTEYTISFLVDNQEYSTLKTAGNEAIELPDEPTKVGYTFNGWYLDEDFESLFNDEYYLDKELTENISIYAKFTINQYTITFNTNEGSTIAPITQDYNSTITKPADSTRSGYTFGGWFTDNGTFNNEYTFTTMPLNGITLYAKWNIDGYTIIYHLDDGINGNNPTSYTILTNDITLEDATKEGHTFNGWYTEQEFINKIETIDTNSLQNYDLYAKFTINQYTISFNTNEGSTIAPITQNYNTAVTKPTDPTRDGYTFDGWYTDNNTFENEFNFTTMPSKDTELFAKYTAIQYSIRYYYRYQDEFNSSWGTRQYKIDFFDNSLYTLNDSLITTYTIEDEIEFDFSNVVYNTKEGYQFSAWGKLQDDDYAGGLHPSDTTTAYISKGTTGNIEIFASFQLINYNIIYHLDGSTTNASPSLNPSSYTVIDSVEFANPTKLGYTFNGWYIESTFENQITKIEKGSIGELNLYPKFEETEYDIIYVLDGGQFEGEYPTSYRISNTSSLPTPSKSGNFVFTGWFYDSSFTANIRGLYDIKGLINSSTTEITLYARFHTINFVLDDGDFDEEPTINSTHYMNSLTSCYLIGQPTKEGYAFDGWYSDEEYTNKLQLTTDGYVLSEIITEDKITIQIYAKFTLITYTITYNLDGGKNSQNNPNSYSILTESQVLEEPTKYGYIFNGWIENSSQPNKTIEISNKETGNRVFDASWTLSHVWIQIDTVYAGTLSDGIACTEQDFESTISQLEKDNSIEIYSIIFMQDCNINLSDSITITKEVYIFGEMNINFTTSKDYVINNRGVLNIGSNKVDGPNINTNASICIKSSRNTNNSLNIYKCSINGSSYSIYSSQRIYIYSTYADFKNTIYLDWASIVVNVYTIHCKLWVELANANENVDIFECLNQGYATSIIENSYCVNNGLIFALSGATIVSCEGYKIFYDLDGGISENTFEYNSYVKNLVINPEYKIDYDIIVPTKENYVFAGWEFSWKDDNHSETQPEISNDTISIVGDCYGDIVLKAKWELA